MTNALAKLDAATRMLAEAKTLDEIKHVRDMAKAAHTYAQAARLGLEACNHAAELKVKAERKAGEFLAKLERGAGGDMSNLDKLSNLPSEYKQVIDDNGIGYKTASRWQKMAKIPQHAFEAALEDSKNGERTITTASVIKMAHAEQNKNKPKPPIPNEKYRVIYADPPWKYGSGNQHGKKEQYTTLGTYYGSMSIDELCQLPVKDMAQDDAVLFLWVTSPLLAECFDVIKAWGFKYKTSIIWDKDAHNVGHYVSVRHELLLICTRGSCKPDSRQLLPSVVKQKRGEHSTKPDTFRYMIDAMYTSGKRIELFARRPADGWEVWGDDVI